MGSFSVKVTCSRHNKPMRDTKIFINFHGFFAGTSTEYTNSDGWAEFWIESGADWIGDVFIKNEKFSDYNFYNGKTLSFSVDCNH